MKAFVETQPKKRLENKILFLYFLEETPNFYIAYVLNNNAAFYGGDVIHSSTMLGYIILKLNLSYIRSIRYEVWSVLYYYSSLTCNF